MYLLPKNEHSFLLAFHILTACPWYLNAFFVWSGKLQVIVFCITSNICEHVRTSNACEYVRMYKKWYTLCFYFAIIKTNNQEWIHFYTAFHTRDFIQNSPTFDENKCCSDIIPPLPFISVVPPSYYIFLWFLRNILYYSHYYYYQWNRLYFFYQ